jgi:hypothetical protein
MNSNGEGKILDMEKELEIKALRNEVQKLTNQLTKYQILLKEIDEGADPSMVSDEESICVTQINRLRQASDGRELSNDEVKNLDVLHKNLKLARGENIRVGAQNKTKKLSDKDLEKLVKG